MNAAKEMPRINTAWFRDRIVARQTSQRKIAKAMGLDPAAISLMLRGKRGVDPREAEMLAVELGVPLSEVLENMGVDITAGAQNTAPVKGWANASGAIHMGRAEGPRKVPVPVGMPANTIALRVQNEGFTDGWLVFYVEGTATVNECVGRLSVIQIQGKNEWYLRVLKRGYSKGTYTLIDSLGAGPSIEDVRVASASPVLWLKTSV